MFDNEDPWSLIRRQPARYRRMLLNAWFENIRERMRRTSLEIEAAYERAKSDPDLLARLNKPINPDP